VFVGTLRAEYMLCAKGDRAPNGSVCLCVRETDRQRQGQRERERERERERAFAILTPPCSPPHGIYGVHHMHPLRRIGVSGTRMKLESVKYSTSTPSARHKVATRCITTWVSGRSGLMGSVTFRHHRSGCLVIPMYMSSEFIQPPRRGTGVPRS